jgi:lipopolysaccharide export system permease protein
LGTILQRTILIELVRVFALSLFGITGILVMAGVVAEASQQGLTPSQILVVIPLLVPSTLPYTIPATTLFATCVVYGRLAHDNEILAIKAAGIHLMKVIVPAAILGIVMSGATMALYYRLIPRTHYMLRSQFLNEVEESLYAMLKKDRCIKQPGLSYSMWVRQVQGKRLIDALFKRRDKTGHYDIIAKAHEAELRYLPASRQIEVTLKHCDLYTENNSTAGHVQLKVVPVELPEQYLTMKNPRPRALTYPELLEQRQEKSTEINRIGQELATQAATLPNQHISNLKEMQRQLQLELWSVDNELSLRPALSAGCLCFVLIGCPVGIWFSRSDYLSAFITCFLPVVFVYYPLILCGTNFVKQGRVGAITGLWAANVLLAFAALGLFRRLLRN